MTDAETLEALAAQHEQWGIECARACACNDPWYSRRRSDAKAAADYFWVADSLRARAALARKVQS